MKQVRGYPVMILLLWAAAVTGCFYHQEDKTRIESAASESPPWESLPKEVIPSSYDCRQSGKLVIAKNQGELGTCWAFAALLALETALSPEESWDFSEDHMSMQNSFSMSREPSIGHGPGGDYGRAMAYLLAWQGPVRESEDPYGDGVSPQGLSAAKHVQEILFLGDKNYTGIKQAVYEYGGVESSLYISLADIQNQSVFYHPDTYGYCYTGPEKPNHEVVIVGWDDEFPKENFQVQPKGDGAFLCVNSWGEAFGDDGFFYVSYFDANIGKYNLAYSGVEASDNYDHIYQADLCGWIGQLGYEGEETAYFANVYEAQGEEMLKAVGFYATGPDTEYEIFVERQAEEETAFQDKRSVGKGKLGYAGFYTISLEQEVPLEAGERYGVIIKITTPGTTRPIAVEADIQKEKSFVDLSDGEGYSSINGTVWERVEETQGCNLCLKAYTVDR